MKSLLVPNCPLNTASFSWQDNSYWGVLRMQTQETGDWFITITKLDTHPYVQLSIPGCLRDNVSQSLFSPQAHMGYD